jgi:hypothetical protein
LPTDNMFGSCILGLIFDIFFGLDLQKSVLVVSKWIHDVIV